MSQTELQKEIMKAVHKVNKLHIDSGESQYMGRGEDSSDVEPEEAPEAVPSNIYDQEDENQYKATKDIMKDIVKRFEYVNEGHPDLPKLSKKLAKIKSMLSKKGGLMAGKADIKAHLKSLKESDPKLYYKVKAKLDQPAKKGKKCKPKAKKGGVAKPMSEKQKKWMSFVDELSKKEKYKGYKRSELMKIASEKYKKN
jgi:hypothetical protein